MIDILRYTLQHSPHIPFDASALPDKRSDDSDERMFLLCQWGLRMTAKAYEARGEFHLSQQLDGLNPIMCRQDAIDARAVLLRIADHSGSVEYGCYWMGLRQMVAQVPDALRPAMEAAHTNTVDADAAANLCLAAERGERTVVALRAGLIAHNLAQEIDPAKVWAEAVEILELTA